VDGNHGNPPTRSPVGLGEDSMRPSSGTIRLSLLMMAWSGLLEAGAPASPATPPLAWETLATGLELATFAGPYPSSHRPGVERPRAAQTSTPLRGLEPESLKRKHDSLRNV